MCTVDPNDNLLLTEVTRIDVNGFEMLNDGNLTLFLGNVGCCGTTWGPNEDLEICSYGNFGDKTHRFHLPTKQ